MNREDNVVVNDIKSRTFWKGNLILVYHTSNFQISHKDNFLRLKTTFVQYISINIFFQAISSSSIAIITKVINQLHTIRMFDLSPEFKVFIIFCEGYFSLSKVDEWTISFSIPQFPHLGHPGEEFIIMAPFKGRDHWRILSVEGTLLCSGSAELHLAIIPWVFIKNRKKNVLQVKTRTGKCILYI